MVPLLLTSLRSSEGRFQGGGAKAEQREDSSTDSGGETGTRGGISSGKRSRKRENMSINKVNERRRKDPIFRTPKTTYEFLLHSYTAGQVMVKGGSVRTLRKKTVLEEKKT